jgi:transposase
VKKLNITKTAKRLGVHRSTIQQWKKDGVNITDESALQDRLAAARKSPDETLAEAKRRRAVADATRAEIRVQQERGELVPAAGIKAEGFSIGLSFRQALEKLAHELPPQLAGQDAPVISKILKKHHRELLTNLSHAHPRFYLKAKA